MIGKEKAQCIRDRAILRPVMIQTLKLRDRRLGAPRLLQQDRLLIQQIGMARTARERIVDAGERLIGFTAIGEQLRLGDLGTHARGWTGSVGSLQQLESLCALTLLVEQRGGALAGRPFERRAAQQLVAAQRRGHIVTPIGDGREVVDGDCGGVVIVQQLGEIALRLLVIAAIECQQPQTPLRLQMQRRVVAQEFERRARLALTTEQQQYVRRGETLLLRRRDPRGTGRRLGLIGLAEPSMRPREQQLGGGAVGAGVECVLTVLQRLAIIPAVEREVAERELRGPALQWRRLHAAQHGERGRHARLLRHRQHGVRRRIAGIRVRAATLMRPCAALEPALQGAARIVDVVETELRPHRRMQGRRVGRHQRAPARGGTLGDLELPAFERDVDGACRKLTVGQTLCGDAVIRRGAATVIALQRDLGRHDQGVGLLGLTPALGCPYARRRTAQRRAGEQRS